MYPNVLLMAAYLVFSIGWFFLGHLLGFFVLGRIAKNGAFPKAAKAAGILAGAWVLIASAVVAISFTITTRTIGFAEVFIAGVLAPLVYLIGVAWLAHRFYGLTRGYALLAALAIGAAYLVATWVLSVIAYVVFMAGLVAHYGSLA